MTPKPATSEDATPGASENPKRHRSSPFGLLDRKKKETPPPPRTTTTAAITDLPDPISQPSLPVEDSEPDLSVKELRSTCEKLEQILASCRGTLEPKLWDQAIDISPSKLETADSLCQWLALASSKRDQTVPSGQPQTLRKQILGGISHAIKATAHIITPTLKSALALGTQLSAVAPYRCVSYVSRFPYLRHWVPYAVQHLLLLKYETRNLPAHEIGYRERLRA
jgi:hypothetical protein